MFVNYKQCKGDNFVKLHVFIYLIKGVHVFKLVL